jgi:hypothetical protein
VTEDQVLNLLIGQTVTVEDGLGDVPQDFFGKVGVVVGHHRLVIGVLSCGW